MDTVASTHAQLTPNDGINQSSSSSRKIMNEYQPSRRARSVCFCFEFCVSIILFLFVVKKEDALVFLLRLSLSKRRPKMKLSAALASLLAAEGVRAFSILPTRHTLAQISGPKGVAPLYGLLDEINSDDYNLMDTSDESEINMNDAYEMFLGDLVFSTNDPRIDIMNNYERATDEDFLGWLEKKIETSTDPEERPALKDLFEIIVDVKKRTDLSKLAKEREAREAGLQEQQRMEQAEADAEAGRQMSNTDVLRKAMSIDSAKSEEDLQSTKPKKTFYDEELTPEIRISYEDQVKKFLPPYKAGETAQSVVFSNYERFDAQFVKVLAERSVSGEEESTALLEALAEEQRKRISTATEALKSVLSMGEPMKMEGAIVRLARDGKIDEAFLLLLEANETQARDAGATGPADLMKKLKKRAAEEKDKQMSSKEIRLIRKLLRADDAQEREQILEDAFTPREGLLVTISRCIHSFRNVGNVDLTFFSNFTGRRHRRKRSKGNGWRTA
jgi:hypothetical protein